MGHFDDDERHDGVAALQRQIEWRSEENGHELGALHFTLNVVKKNKAAISLYQKLGYEKYGQSSTEYIKMNKTLETD